MKIISSKQNSSIKKVVDLHTTKGRQQHQQYIAEGIRVLEQFATANITPAQLYMTETAYNAMDPFPGIHPILVSDDVMAKMSTLTTPPGVLAVFNTSTVLTPLKSLTTQAKGLVLVDLQDPGNIGTLIRSAVAFNYTTIIMIDGADPLSSKVIQASAGTIASVKLIQCSWDELIQHATRPPLCALVISGKNSNTEELKKHCPLLVIGNEARGLPTDWSKECEHTFTIPMNVAAESLNASVAGSIALYLLQP